MTILLGTRFRATWKRSHNAKRPRSLTTTRIWVSLNQSSPSLGSPERRSRWQFFTCIVNTDSGFPVAGCILTSLTTFIASQWAQYLGRRASSIISRPKLVDISTNLAHLVLGTDLHACLAKVDHGSSRLWRGSMSLKPYLRRRLVEPIKIRIIDSRSEMSLFQIAFHILLVLYDQIPHAYTWLVFVSPNSKFLVPLPSPVLSNMSL